MAIGSYTLDYLISAAADFRNRNNQTVLELGESEVQSFDLATCLSKITDVTGLPLDTLQAELTVARQAPDRARFEEAQLVYRWLLNQSEYRDIDLGSRNPANRIDLNYATDLESRYDVVINNGTSEHIFNQANVFKFIHDHTKVGGFMIHYTTGMGWVDHGFYNVQPRFFLDLAKYNGYKVHSCCLVNEAVSVPLIAGQVDNAALSAHPHLHDALLHCCMQRWDSAPFRYPIQWPYHPS